MLQNIALVTAFTSGMLAAATASPTSFAKVVRPLLKRNCEMCHNQALASGGLDLTPFYDRSSVPQKREGWERIISKLHSGEMPRRASRNPAAEERLALENYVQGELDRVDRAAKPDPGRVTARLLNRAEYSNTVRDSTGRLAGLSLT